MDWYFIAELFSWRMVKRRKRLTSTLNHLDQSISSSISVIISSILKHLMYYYKTMISLVSLWWMVAELYLRHYRETIEKSSKRYRFNFLKSMVEEVNHQSVLLGWERRRDTIIWRKLLNCVLSISSVMINQMWSVSLLPVLPALKLNSPNQIYSIRD